MKCELYEELFIGRLQHTLTAEQDAALEQHLKGCPACREELIALSTVWQDMETIEAPEPSVMMEDNFNAMLQNYKQAQAKQSAMAKLRKRLGPILE